jgi:predicted small secreted protein
MFFVAILLTHNETILMKTTTRRLLPFLFCAIALAFLATSCNTIRGAGRDVEATGNNIQEATR